MNTKYKTRLLSRISAMILTRGFGVTTKEDNTISIILFFKAQLYAIISCANKWYYLHCRFQTLSDNGCYKLTQLCLPLFSQHKIKCAMCFWLKRATNYFVHSSHPIRRVLQVYAKSQCRYWDHWLPFFPLGAKLTHFHGIGYAGTKMHLAFGCRQCISVSLVNHGNGSQSTSNHCNVSPEVYLLWVICCVLFAKVKSLDRVIKFAMPYCSPN